MQSVALSADFSRNTRPEGKTCRSLHAVSYRFLPSCAVSLRTAPSTCGHLATAIFFAILRAGINLFAQQVIFDLRSRESRWHLIFLAFSQKIKNLFQALMQCETEERHKRIGIVFQLKRANSRNIASSTFSLNVDWLVSGPHEQKITYKPSRASICIDKGMDALKFQMKQRSGYNNMLL